MIEWYDGVNLQTIDSLDEDVILLTSSYFQIRPASMKAKILEWDYESQEVATYLMLLDRKLKYGEKVFHSFGININTSIKVKLTISLVASCSSNNRNE